MKRTFFIAAALTVSWILSGMVGGLLALRFGRLGVMPVPTIRTRGLEVIGPDGTARIIIGSEKDQPSLRFLTSEGAPLIRVGVDLIKPYPGSVESSYLLPSIALNDGAGNPAIELAAMHNQRGIIGFSSSTLPERMALGYFGITDDSTDTGMWGLHVLGDPNGHRTDPYYGRLYVQRKRHKLGLADVPASEQSKVEHSL